MALVIADRIKETTTTTGTGSYTLAGAVSGFESFNTIGDGNTTYYVATDNVDFEVGIGTYTASGTTLARTTILQSSNSDAAVNWGVGSRDVFCTVPAEKMAFLDANGNLTGGPANITTDSFTGDNTTTAFTVTTAPTDADDLLVTINGLIQRPTTDYTVSGTTLTFTTAPFTGANVFARLIGGSGSGGGGSVDLSAVDQDIIPDADITRDLGTSSKRFKDLYLSGNTIDLGGATFSVDATSGAVAVVPKSTTGTPNPVGVVFTSGGEMKTVTSSGGAVTSSEIETAADSNDVTPSTTVVTNPTDLPSSPAAGTTGYVTSNNKLYIYNGTAWYVFAGTNEAPTISGLNAAYTLATDGTPTVITMSSSDPEGLPVTFSSSTSGLGSIATISQSNNVFTITPSTNSANAGTFTLVITGTDGVNSVSTATATITLPGGLTATGGDTVVESGGYKIHTFTSSGTFAVTGSGTVEYLVVGGGGGGGQGGYGANGGGGAGGYRSSVAGESSGGGASAESPLSVSSGNYTVTIGAGGAAAASQSVSGSNGGDSVFGSITAIGGGGGGSATGGGSPSIPNVGGSGGGSGRSTVAGAAGTANQGYAGGTGGPYGPPNYPGGGGGGAGAVGVSPANSSANGGDGGAGVASSITGTSVTRAGGGGGGTETGTAGAGGAGGGGAGRSGGSGGGVSGTANTGGGGGAGGLGAGGSGIVIIRYAV